MQWCPISDCRRLHQATLSTHLTNGPVRGDLPIVGTTQLHIGSVDLGNIVPGLKLGVIDVTLPEAGGLATIKGVGSYSDQNLSFGGTLGVPEHPDGRISVPVDVNAQTGSTPSASVRDSLSVKGKLTLNTGSFHGLDAAVQLRTSALADLRPVVSPALPGLTDVLLSGRLAIPANANSLLFTGAKLTSHEGDLAGDVTVGVGQPVTLAGKVHSTKLDLEGVLRAFNIGPHSNTEPIRSPTGPLISVAPLPWPLLRGPDIDLTVDVGTVTFQQQALHDLEMTMTVKDSRLNVGRLMLAPALAGTSASVVDEAGCSHG